MNMIKRINHMAIVAPDLDAATGFWAEALGLPVTRIEDVPAEGVRVAFLPVGESNIELLQPTDAESGVARYLEKRGPGMHHVCLEVDDIDAALARLKAANVPLINDEARAGHGGTRYAFIHPKGTGGVLIELYELAADGSAADGSG
ncbi:MAG: methylmalonyl-CoA epimerase [Anaerolineales bacterium]|nr:methylmalonyl-CoA epimerase [Anaerolineales bacterium]